MVSATLVGRAKKDPAWPGQGPQKHGQEVSMKLELIPLFNHLEEARASLHRALHASNGEVKQKVRELLEMVEQLLNHLDKELYEDH